MSTEGGPLPLLNELEEDRIPGVHAFARLPEPPPPHASSKVAPTSTASTPTALRFEPDSFTHCRATRPDVPIAKCSHGRRSDFKREGFGRQGQAHAARLQQRERQAHARSSRKNA